MGQQVLKHRFGSDGGSETVAGTHHAEALPLAELCRKSVKAHSPIGGIWQLGGRTWQIQLGMHISRKAGKGLALFLNASSNEVTPLLADCEVLGPEMVKPTGRFVAETHQKSPFVR
jgi:hypothetical protein